MNENLTIALQITLVGMGLVSAAILLLWGVMALLVRLTASSVEAEAEQERAALTELERKRRAAAAAVAIALAQTAEATEPHEFPLPPTAIVSAWQAVMRTRILNKRGPTR